MDSFTTEETLAYESILLLVLATRAPPRGDGGQQSNLAEPWVNGYRAVMASTSKCFTMQGRDTPVSATGQGEKAGPQSSSSSDRSSTLVGNLASLEYNATRNQIHTCNKDRDSFCCICGEFELAKYRKPLTEKLKSVYSKCFGINITKQGEGCMPNKICGRSNTMLWKWEKSNERKHLLFSKPMMWSTPASREDCYFCMTKTSGFTAATKALPMSTNAIFSNFSRVFAVFCYLIKSLGVYGQNKHRIRIQCGKIH